jgi:hypothetical protein
METETIKFIATAGLWAIGIIIVSYGLSFLTYPAKKKVKKIKHNVTFEIQGKLLKSEFKRMAAKSV